MRATHPAVFPGRRTRLQSHSTQGCVFSSSLVFQAFAEAFHSRRCVGCFLQDSLKELRGISEGGGRDVSRSEFHVGCAEEERWAQEAVSEGLLPRGQVTAHAGPCFLTGVCLSRGPWAWSLTAWTLDLEAPFSNCARRKGTGLF